MIKCFKSTMILYFVFSFIGGVPICLKLGWDINFYVGVLVATIWIFTVAMVLEIFAQIKMRKIINIMMDDCNLEEYIRICDDLLFDQTNKKLVTLLMLNLSTGYLNAGNRERAKKTLNSIVGFGNGIAGAIYLAIYYNNLVAYYFMIKDIENVVDSMEEFRIALDNKKLSRVYKNKLLYSYSDSKVLLNMANNIYDGAEQVFNDALLRAKHMLSKVSAKYTLGIIYLHYNRLSEATEAFEFAIKNGGTSCYVSKAKEHLEEMK